MAANYYTLPRKRGKDNMGGMGTKVRFCSLDAMNTVKGLKTTTEPGDKVTIDGSHAWKAGQGCNEIYFTQESTTLKAEPQGEIGGMSQKVTGGGFYPGISKVGAELARQGGNDEFLAWMQDPNGPTDEWIQIGSEHFPAVIKCAFDSAQAASGRKGYTITIEASMLGLTFYSGTFTLAPEAVNSGAGTEDAESFVG